MLTGTLPHAGLTTNGRSRSMTSRMNDWKRRRHHQTFLAAQNQRPDASVDPLTMIPALMALTAGAMVASIRRQGRR